MSAVKRISTPTPLAGRDLESLPEDAGQLISTPTPLAGRDGIVEVIFVTGMKISTPTPLAGRDAINKLKKDELWHFYSHAPRGA